MKRNNLLIVAMIATLFGLTTACNTIHDDVLTYDNETGISSSVPTMQTSLWNIVNNADETSGSISYTSNAQLQAFAQYNFADVVSASGTVNYTVAAIPETRKTINNEVVNVRLTRDVIVYLKSVGVKYKGYGYFNYPVNIRQYGNYTQYLSADELMSYVDKVDSADQYYALGTVVSVGNMDTDSYPITKYPVNPQLFYDRGAIYGVSEEQCPSNLNEKFLTLTVNVNGTNVKFLLNDLERDDILDQFAGKVKAGDTVEICLIHANYDKNFGGIVNVNPLAVYIK